MAIRIPFAGKYVYFGPETGLHTQGEARAETYDLTGPRYYDGHDLSALTWYVRATHPDYHTIINKQLSVTIAPDDEEAVVISWPVDADFMACSGELQVQFVAKSAAGTEIIKLQSNGLQISPSVEGTAAPPKNMFEAALAQMQDLADTAANAAAQSKQDAERADDAVATTAENVAVAEKAVETAKESVKEAAGLVEQTEAKAAAAEASAKLAESWAVGGTGSREGEDTDNAKYYAQIAQQVAQGGVGYYETPEALRTAHPTGQAGNWAIVGSTDTIWVWDTDTGDWVDSHGNINLSNYYTKTEAEARFSAISSGVPTVSATKEQNYFDIELPSTNQFVIVPNAAYATGDTFRIAGRAVAAKLPNGDSLPNAFFAANAKVMCLWADTILYFVGGGGGTVPNNVMRYRMDDGTPAQPPTPINADTLQGHAADYFATAAQFAQVAPYKAGDVISAPITMATLLTSGNTKIRILVPLNAKVEENVTAKISGEVQVIQDGKYLVGASGVSEDISVLSPAASISPFGLYVTLSKDNFGGANNSPVMVACSEFTVTFEEAT